MEEIKVVIGANFGDEGKGQMTEYFAHQAKEAGKSCLVVLHNGTAQRGHTCIMNDGCRRIYHHFGSGTAVSADTYFSEEFVVNPMFFRKEYEELEEKGFRIKTYVNSNCKIAIPFDILINQEIETLRGTNRHGSCGYGFYETLIRNKNDDFKTIIFDSYNLKAFYSQMLNIRNVYVTKRCQEIGIEELDIHSKFYELLMDDTILDVFLEDLKFFLSHTTLVDDRILKSYDWVVFEGAQGLLLDMDNREYYPHLTPSKTGLYNPYQIIKRLISDCPVEVCYVTRTYLTRHGAGRLDAECKKSEINSVMMDLTNTSNEFQETLRYAKLNVDEMRNRIDKDFSIAADENNFSYQIAVMHENEYALKELVNERYHSNGASKLDIYNQEEKLAGDHFIINYMNY